jgi:hypothetical protein
MSILDLHVIMPYRLVVDTNVSEKHTASIFRNEENNWISSDAVITTLTYNTGT